jgi:membrane protease YdiL (CAAX protease family)
LAALIVTAAAEGVAGLRRLFGRLLIWRVGWGWYGIALLLPAGVSLLTTALHMMLGGDAPDFSDPPVYRAALPGWLKEYNAWTILAPVFLQQLLLGTPVGEELGWRGFALARLQGRFRALDATLMISAIWALWAQPLLHLQPGRGWVMPFLVLLIGGIPAQILTTWIFNSTAGSLLLVILFNNAYKVTDLFLAAPVTSPVIPVAAYWITTLIVVSAVGTNRLTLRPAPSNPAAGTDRAGSA